jgi:hypothetical protein
MSTETAVATTDGKHTPALVRTGKSLAQLEAGIAHYPDRIRTEVTYLQGFYLDHCRNNLESLRATCAKLGADKSRVYFANLIGGQYFRADSNKWQEGGKAWSEFLEMMAALRRHAVLIARTGQLQFVQTPTYHCIANFITAMRAPSAVCRIGGIIAPTGGQTSASFKFYRDLNNHGTCIHVEAPASGRLSALRAKILDAYHVSGCKIERRGELEIRAQVNESRTVIIDNAQVLYSKSHGTNQPCFNWIRELYDDKRPTFILKFTEEFLSDMTGELAKGYFEQFIGRMGGIKNLLRLPDYAPDGDLQCIADAFKLAPSSVADYLTPWSRETGRIRIVFDRLQRAQEFAKIEGRDRILLADLKAADEYTPPSVGTYEPNGGDV